MVPVNFKELFLAEFYHESKLSLFPLAKTQNKTEQSYNTIAVEWFSQSENGTFVSTLPVKDFTKYDLRKHLILKACEMRLFVDLPKTSSLILPPMERENVLSMSETLLKLGELSDDEQECLAKDLINYTTEIGLSSLSLRFFRLTKGENNWALLGFEPTIFQNPSVLHSRENTRRFLSMSLLKSLSKPLQENRIDVEKLEPQDTRLAPFFEEIKKIHKESTTFSITKIVLSIVSFGLLPLYYLIKCCWKFTQISRLKKRLLKLTFKENPYKERADKVLDCCIKMTQQLGSARIEMQNRQVLEL